ncbi:MAG: 16S rRNA (adenine(1518)-N(6)/adenine(1519)-N(6))-dimethyltransferase RsmA [Coriobacteriia bacterium]|nr:16S rRNA (adenine(1518)-N(6)/adenine(1519)-N(6))-dimethyltransferase RsmA [Coriobacteriia bacterium]
MYSPYASPKATIEVLKKTGLYTKKNLGQHFLIDDNVIGHILSLAAIRAEDVIVEVGPGIGTLTCALLDTEAHIVAVEFDPALPALLEETFGARDNFVLVVGDAVKVTSAELGAAFGEPTALVANLPYQVAATVVLRFFETLPSLQSATVMVQAEVAQRMAAHPGSKSYGAYTVKLNLLAHAVGNFAVSRNSFLPPPRVESTVIRLEKRSLVANVEEYKKVARIIDCAFAQRRKTIRNSLKATLEISTETLEKAFLAAGIDPQSRAEMLEANAFITLAQKIQDLTKIFC